mmetsp:Transcript_33995/g.108489  ORF Transcript_33995/g.108489 Transcript_33995/m.108489 type:complete len:325 (+) Transcript_33995:104-1078(+)
MDEDDDCDCSPARADWTKGAAALALASVLLFASSWDVLEPTEWGVVQNVFTGYVELDPERVFEGGRHFIWLRHSFIKFPRRLVNLEFSDFGRGESDQAPISARTGPDPDDKESGGQPIRLCVAFQYQIARRDVPRIYQTFGALHEASYLRFAQQAITNEAQMFTPRAFWTDRKKVEGQLLGKVNETLYRQGYATVHDLQLLRVDFNSNYEDTITSIQLQEQLKVTKTYQLEVTRVSKEVDILSAEAEAAIARINAQAQREASVTINQASAAAIQMEQGAKATWYAKLKATLGWSNDDFLRYVKIKSLNAQPGGSVVIGVDAVGG